MAKWVEYLNSDAQSTMTNCVNRTAGRNPGVRFWGVGNGWGCGGNMTAEYYSDQYKRYATYARNYNHAPLAQRIACGPSGGELDRRPDENVAHPYVGTDAPPLYHSNRRLGQEGSATSFDEKEYFSTMRNCLQMDELVTRHSTIMDNMIRPAGWHW